VEPENRLVARALEHRWEEALGEQRRLEEDYRRFLRERPPELSAAERERIAALAQSLPDLWHAVATTGADRQAIVRHLIARVVLTAHGETEQLDAAIHWHGGHVTRHAVTRSVGAYERLGDYPRLRARVSELWAAGSTTTTIARMLNEDGFHTPDGRHCHTRKTVRRLLDKWGLSQPIRAQLDAARSRLERHECWLVELASELGISRGTLARWCRRGWMHARQLSGPCRWWVVWADAAERDRLRRLYAYGRGNVGPDGGRYPEELRTPKPRHARRREAKTGRTKKRSG